MMFNSVCFFKLDNFAFFFIDIQKSFSEVYFGCTFREEGENIKKVNSMYTDNDVDSRRTKSTVAGQSRQSLDIALTKKLSLAFSSGELKAG